MTDLGIFAVDFASLRAMMATGTTGQPAVRWKLFASAAAGAARCVSRGLNRAAAAEALLDIAHANGLDDDSAIQDILVEAFDDAIDVVPLPFDEPYQNGNGHAKPRAPSGTAKGRFKLKPFEQITISTARNYSVKGVLPGAGLAVVWGPPKCGKSFWAFDLMMHVALGWMYRGRRVRQGPVVYLALEGGHGFSARVEAWRNRHLSNHFERVPFYLIDVQFDMLADHGELIAAIQLQLGGVHPVAIVIDTLNRALIGDENKSDDMARFIRAADRIGKAFECLVTIIHHCGVQGSRPRGHTSLTGADDAQIAVERNEHTGIITARVEHQKDGESGAVLASRLERVEVAFDEDGDAISSCIIVATEPARPPPLLKGNTKIAYELLQGLVEDEGDVQPEDGRTKPNPVAVSAIKWRELYCAAASGTPDSRVKAFVRATAKLQDLKIIKLYGVWVWLPDKTDKSGQH